MITAAGTRPVPDACLGGESTRKAEPDVLGRARSCGSLHGSQADIQLTPGRWQDHLAAAELPERRLRAPDLLSVRLRDTQALSATPPHAADLWI
jgi:hypothetical protein